MEVPRVEKQQFHNRSGGWIGVVVINAKGEDTGASVEPDGTVWLSEQEQILTANAPRRAEDNPFIAQKHQRVNPETSEIETYEITPLVPISENRYVPAGDRPIPGTIDSASAAALAQAEAVGDEPVQSRVEEDPVGKRQAQVDAEGQDASPNPPATPPRAAAAVQAAQGANAAPEEETAAAQTVPEETGAAVPPAGQPVEGEFAAHEEVGTPSAPAEPQPQTSVEGTAAAGPPKPWTPATEEPGTTHAPAPDPSGE